MADVGDRAERLARHSRVVRGEHGSLGGGVLEGRRGRLSAGLSNGLKHGGLCL